MKKIFFARKKKCYVTPPVYGTSYVKRMPVAEETKLFQLEGETLTGRGGKGMLTKVSLSRRMRFRPVHGV